MGEWRTAETPIASTVPEPFGSPAGPGLWHHQGLALPAYIQHVAHRLVLQGHDRSQAIGMAVGIVRNWADGHDGHGNKVHADVQAAAVKAMAEWEAAKAETGGGKRFDPFHLPAGAGGGQFTTAGGGGGGGGKAAPAAHIRPPKKAGPPAHQGVPALPAAQHARKERLLAQAHADREKAAQFEAQLHTLEQQEKAALHAAAKSKASAHQAAKGGHRTAHKHHSATHHRHTHHARSLRQRITHLKQEIHTLLGQATSLESQAKGLRALALATEVRNAEGSAGMALDVRAQLGAAGQNDLPDDAFAYVESGGTKDSSGKTVPRSLRHFPVHDAAHTRNALARAPQSPFGDKALPKIKAAARKFGIDTGEAGRSLLADEEVREMRINSCYKDLDLSLETRSAADGTWIGGYASVFQPRESRNLGGFIERVASHAFNDAKMDGWPDVVCRFNHNSDLVLGTVAAGTLQLRTDQTGLDYQVIPPDSRSDVRELVQRGDVRFSSFAFRVPRGGDEWGVTDQNFPVRTLHSVELVDVAPVLTPAYPNATAAVRATAPALRSLADHMQITVDEVRTLADADELRRLFVRTDRPVYRPEPKRLFGPQAAALLLTRKADPFAEED